MSANDKKKPKIARRDPMLCIYLLQFIFLVLAILGAKHNIAELWGSGVACFSVLGLYTCYVTYLEARAVQVSADPRVP